MFGRGRSTMINKIAKKRKRQKKEKKKEKKKERKEMLLLGKEH